MIKGKVVGRLWATKRVASLPQGGLLEIELENGARLIAFDPLGCAEGEEVLVTQGSVAAGSFREGEGTCRRLDHRFGRSAVNE